MRWWSMLFMFLPVYAPAAIDGDQERLPIVLTISGGVSLGNYQAGINWLLIDALRQFNHPGPKGPFVVNKSTGRRMNVELTSISGASAGSINTLLSTLLYCQDGDGFTVDTNSIKSAWIGVGFHDLLPSSDRAYLPLPEQKRLGGTIRDSLLSRKPFLAIIDDIKRRILTQRYRLKCPLKSLAFVVTRDQAVVTQVEGVELFNQRFIVALETVIQPAAANAGGGRLTFRNKRLQKNYGSHQLLLPENAQGEIPIDHVIRSIMGGIVELRQLYVI